MSSGTKLTIGIACVRPISAAPQPSWKTAVDDAVGGGDREQVHRRRLERDHDRAEREQQDEEAEARRRSAIISGSLSAIFSARSM